MAGVALQDAPSGAALAAALPRIVAALPVEALRSRRWFAGKARDVASVGLLDHLLVDDGPPLFLALLEVAYRDGGREAYALPLVFEPERAGVEPLLRLSTPQGPRLALDGVSDPRYARWLFRLAREGRQARTARGVLLGEPTAPLRIAPEPLHTRLLGAEQSNTTLLFDRDWVLKHYRRLEAGRSRDLELGRFFAEDAPFAATPELAGGLEHRDGAGGVTTLGLLQRYVPNQGDGWSFVLAALEPSCRGWLAQPGPDVAARVRAELVALRAVLVQLGEVTAAMHAALGSRADIPAFAPEDVQVSDLRAWADDLDAQARRAFALAANAGSAERQLGDFLARRAHLEHQLAALFPPGMQVAGRKIQVHGDFHLGQVLWTQSGWMVIDFEGEPARPLSERRAKQSPLRDVAGMLRSCSYAAHAAARALGAEPDHEHAARWVCEVEEALGAAFRGPYLAAMAGTGLLPEQPERVERLLRAFQVAKAFYELAYELNNRPDWVAIPIRGIERLLGAEAGSGGTTR